MSSWVRRVITVLLCVMTTNSGAYPLYGSEERAIRRLEADRLIQQGVIAGRQKLPGELLHIEQVDVRLLARPNVALPSPDPELSAKITALLGDRAEHYAVAVLDLSRPDHSVYAVHAADRRSGLGSIGKIIAALALFQALADLHPDDPEKRLDLLRHTTIRVDELVAGDLHKVRFYDPVSQTLTRRVLSTGDNASLWEYLDWMISASSNAAANVIMQQAMLLNHFGEAYPVSGDRATRLFTKTSSEHLSDLFHRTFVEPLARSSLDEAELRQGGFFARRLRELIPATSSRASARGLLMFLLRLEQGRIVDPFSSTEIKRLLYVTERRVRYAASPALRGTAVYIKSGSLYSCQPEEDYQCRQFMGNKLNLMNSIAIVESPAGDYRHFYLVALMSNVLRRDSALDHQSIATRILRVDRGERSINPGSSTRCRSEAIARGQTFRGASRDATKKGSDPGVRPPPGDDSTRVTHTRRNAVHGRAGSSKSDQCHS